MDATPLPPDQPELQFDQDHLAQLVPQFQITVTTPRLSLRVPREAEIVALAQVAADGVHLPGERPFLSPWTEVEPAQRARAVLQSHWWKLASWSPEQWQLGLGIFTHRGAAIGVVSLRTTNFYVTKEVNTSSWLGLRFHGQGYGTEARAGALALAFDYLGATDATTEVFPDNHASHAVSRKLGYLPDGISRDPRGDEVVVSDRLRLTQDRWQTTRDMYPVKVTGLQRDQEFFGALPQTPT